MFISSSLRKNKTSFVMSSLHKFSRKTTVHDEIFIDFMEKNRELAMGFCKRDKYTQNKLWSELAEKLNACGPIDRSIAEWRKTWTDWKRHIKHKIGHNQRESQSIEAGQVNKCMLSTLEERVAILCGLYAMVDDEKNGETNKNGNVATSSKTIVEENTTDGHSDSMFTVGADTPPPATESSASSSDDTTPKETVTPKRKQRKKPDVNYMMSEWSRNFKTMSREIKSLRESKEKYKKRLRIIDNKLDKIESKMDELIGLKKEEIAEMKRHHINLEKESLTRSVLCFIGKTSP
ncbi:uncharacterized protein LOC142222521 [Haematobia irritans]|uniref:uncharacterized protein LOC142222521 n=1 Tax=Haematobia irritans TaxID=7368 RepID=UPI003F4FE8E8